MVGSIRHELGHCDASSFAEMPQWVMWTPKQGNIASQLTDGRRALSGGGPAGGRAAASTRGVTSTSVGFDAAPARQHATVRYRVTHQYQERYTTIEYAQESATTVTQNACPYP